MYKFDIALSYEGASEKLVQEVADFLIGGHLQVFYAPYYQKEMVSANLKSELFQIYQNESLVKVLFVTEKYLKSQYTQLEQRRALSSTKQEPKRLIIVNFVGKKLPEELKKYVYLNGSLPTDEIADFIIDRIRQLKIGISNAQTSHSPMADAQNIRKDTTASAQTQSDAKGVTIKNVNVIENNNGVIFGDSAQIGNLTIK